MFQDKLHVFCCPFFRTLMANLTPFCSFFVYFSFKHHVRLILCLDKKVVCSHINYTLLGMLCICVLVKTVKQLLLRLSQSHAHPCGFVSLGLRVYCFPVLLIDYSFLAPILDKCPWDSDAVFVIFWHFSGFPDKTVQRPGFFENNWHFSLPLPIQLNWKSGKFWIYA